MNYKLQGNLKKIQKTDCAVVTVDQSGNLSEFARQIDELTEGKLSATLKLGDMPSQAGNTLLIPIPEDKTVKRILVVATGEDEELNINRYKKCLESIYSAVNAANIKKLTLSLDGFDTLDKSDHWKLKALVESFEAKTYQFNEFKSKEAPPVKLKDITIRCAEDRVDTLDEALQTGIAVSQGVSVAKDLGNLPGNVCTPTYLAKQAKQFAKTNPEFTVTVLDEKEMKNLGMGSLLSVSAGSAEPAKLIIFEYQGGKASAAPHVLVGKGITFDTGGISLKPGEAMDEMKYDMCGAASVFGAMQAISQIKPKLNIVGIVAAAENMPSGTATKPGDIVTTMSGQTVEILNTDAEGRLVLCDALTYAEKFKPASVVDIATLTGACIIALGHHATGLMSNNESLADELLVAGEEAADKAWRLPLWDEYQSQLDSNFADMQNIGGRPAGTITAACFLARFTKKYPWAHLDIAGVAWNSGKNKGATGRPVPLLVSYLLNKLAA
ncbi:leucyl aminopeptidase [Oleiphilus messinensis]|nr:leucyl aminopeptidase [Oleiphilus messinensis]